MHEAQSDAQAAEEGKEQNISVMRYKSKSKREGSRNYTAHLQMDRTRSGTVQTGCYDLWSNYNIEIINRNGK